MATLINWLEDPLRKKGGLNTRVQQILSQPRSRGPVAPKNLNIRDQNYGGRNLPQLSTSRQNTAPLNIAHTVQNNAVATVINSLQSPKLNTLRPSIQTLPQLSIHSKNNSPELNTIDDSSRISATLSPTLELPTATNKTNKTSLNTQNNNGNSELMLERANQAKQRYDSLRDNDNEFWSKYQSALDTTKDKYKNLLGESIQSRSANQLGSGLKKLATEQGGLPATGEEFVNKYRSLSNDDKWDVWQNLQKAKTTLTQAIGKADDEGQEELKNAYGTLLSEVAVYDDMIAGEDRGKKSLGKSFGDWITSGGIIGNMAEPATNALGTISEIMGNKGGAETARAVSQNNANQNYGNNKVFDAVNFAGSTVGNIAGNMATGGAYGLVNAGLGLADSASSAITDRNRNYYTDADGNLIRENQSTESKLAGLGNSALSAGLTVAGMKGLGPNINFKDGQTLQGLIANKNFGGIGKAMGKYAAKEVPFALATTAASQGISALGGDKNFTDDFGTELTNNIIGDLAVDLTGAARQGKGGKAKLGQRGGLRGLIAEAKNSAKGGVNRAAKVVDNAYSGIVNKGAINRLADGLERGADGNIKFARIGKDVFDDINKVRLAQGLEPLTRRQVTAYQNAVNNNLNNRVNEGMDARRVAQIAYNSLTNMQSEALLGKHKNTVVVAPYAGGGYDGTILGKAQDGGTSLKSIEPRSENFVKDGLTMKKDLLKGRLGSPLTANQEGSVIQPRTVNSAGSSTSLGSQRPESPATPLGVLNSIIPQGTTDVNTKNQLNSYYQKYGSDFYDKLPDNLKTDCETMLDNAPRAKDGTYTDPITGEQWIDETNNIDAKNTSSGSNAGRKQAQFDLLQKTNPMADEYHTGIRKADEILTFKEALAHPDAGDEFYTYPDWTTDNAKSALMDGKVTVYSSHPIKDGTFVTPSKMMAQDYAGSGKVYSKIIPLDDVGWINGDEGNYLPVNVKPIMPLTSMSNVMRNKDTSSIQKPNLSQKAKSSLDTIRDIMAGKSQRLAYAGAGELGRHESLKNNNNSIRTDMTIVKGAAPDGGDLVVADKAINTNGKTRKELQKEARSILNRIRKNSPLKTSGGKSLDTSLSRKSINKIQSKATETVANVSPHVDEILQSTRPYQGNIVSDDGRHPIASRGWEYPETYIQDAKGNVKKVVANIGVDDNGNRTLYDVQLSQNTPQQSYVKRGTTYRGSSDTIVAQPAQDVNTRNTPDMGQHTRSISTSSIAQGLQDSGTKAQIDNYYSKYGPDFYDKLSDALKADYDAMLDTQPRDEAGRYADPITGEKWIDESAKHKAKSSLDAIRSIMSGNKAQRLAYAGVDGEVHGNNKFNNMRSDMTIERGTAPDGSDLVKIDNKVFDGVPNDNKSRVQALKKFLKDKFQGKALPLNYGKDGSADLLKAGIKEISRSGTIGTRGRVAGNLDEVLQVSKLDPNRPFAKDTKNHAHAKDGFEYRTSYVEVDGDIYQVRANIALDGNKKTFHTLNKVENENPPVPFGSSNRPESSEGEIRDTSGEVRLAKGARTPASVYDTSIAQNTANVNTKSQLDSLYKKYGSDFYDKLPDNLRDTYDALLDNAPRSKDGTYTDPITGEKWIDESAKPRTEEINVKEYVKSQVAAQKAENKTPIKQKVQDTLDNLKHYLVDDAVAYERYVKDKGDRMNLREGVDRVRYSDTIARQMIEDSGLAEAIGKMKTEEANEFQQYLIAKRSQELKRTKGAEFKTGRNDVADQALIKSVGNKYAEQEKVVREFNKKMLDYSVDAGLISKALRDRLIKDNTDYVPMNRVLDDIADMGMHKSKQLGNLSKQTAVQKIKGSDRIVQNPLESMIRNAIRTVNEGERNKVAKQLSETAAFREARLPEGSKPRPGNDKLSFIVNGEKVSYEVPALVAKEMKNLNSVMPDFAQKILNGLGLPTKVLRTGATSANPMFALSNLVRDQLQTTITGNLKTNLKGTPKALRATFGIGKEGKALQAELARRGIIGSEYRQTYGYKSGEIVKELQQTHQLPKQAWQKLKHPIDTLADVIGKTEYFTRAQQYFGTDGTVIEKSQAARNNTLNFGRAGSTVRVLNKVIPFLNAGVQGGRITVRQFKERPVRTTLAVATFAGIAAAVRGVNSAKNQELWDRLGDEEKKSNLVIFGDDAHYDPDTNRVVGVIKVPLPQMVYPITEAVNNLKGKPEDLMLLGGDIFTAITGIDAENPVNQLTPTAAKPFLEWSMNKNTYTGQELVSDYDSNLNPEDKGKKYTTGVARSVAKATGIDAPVIDNFIQNWGGGLFKDLTKVMTDNPDNKSDGGGVGKIFSQGAFRRFMSGAVESQYDIQATLAEDYKKRLRADPAFQALDANEQKKALDCIDTDTKAIAGYAAKTEQGRSNEITKELSKRQKSLMENGFDVNEYNQPSKSSGGHDVEISDAISDEHKKTLDTYNSMDKADWEKYIYSIEGRDAEYKLALAKFENDKANDELTEVEELKRKKELRKLKISQAWDKDVRDAYSLAGSKTDMQDLLDGLDNRDDMVGYLNALNRAMYDAGVITASTYKSRNRNINNLGSSTTKSKSGRSKSKTTYSTASRAALSAYVKSLTSSNGIKVNKSANAPSTNRKMSAAILATSIKKSRLGAQAKVSVKKGIA